MENGVPIKDTDSFKVDPEMKAEFEAQQKLGPLGAIKAAASGEVVGPSRNQQKGGSRR
jgi:hypothetical protein